MLCLVSQSCPTLFDPMDFRLPGSSVHGILQVGCYFLLQGIFQTQGLNPGLLHCRQILYHQPPGKLHTKHKENYKGLKITVCRCSWGKFWTRCKKTKKPKCHFRRAGSKNSTVHAPRTQHHQGGGQTTQAIPLAQPLGPPPSSPL